jgi:hypothetical protein
VDTKNLARGVLGAALLGGALLLGACDSEPEDQALRAAAIAREIQADPEQTEAILEQHELSIEEFEALMYEVAGDPELSERYEAALAAE